MPELTNHDNAKVRQITALLILGLALLFVIDGRPRDASDLTLLLPMTWLIGLQRLLRVGFFEANHA